MGFGADLAELGDTVGDDTVDVVIVDESVAGGITSTTLRSLRYVAPVAGLIVMAQSPALPTIRLIGAAGAAALVSPDISTDRLIAAVRDASGDDFRAIESKTSKLSMREVQVLRLISLGMTNSAIGLHLNVAPGTVKRHANSIYKKLDVTSRSEAACAARLLGLVK